MSRASQHLRSGSTLVHVIFTCAGAERLHGEGTYTTLPPFAPCCDTAAEALHPLLPHYDKGGTLSVWEDASFSNVALPLVLEACE